MTWKKIPHSQNFLGGGLRRLYIYTQKCKGRFFEDSAAEIFVQQYVNNTTTKIMNTLFFKEWSHNISNML